MEGRKGKRVEGGNGGLKKKRYFTTNTKTVILSIIIFSNIIIIMYSLVYDRISSNKCRTSNSSRLGAARNVHAVK